MDEIKRIKSYFEEIVELIKNHISDDNTEENLLLYYFACIFKIWGSNVLFSKDYVSLVNTFTGNEYTVEQMITAMSCCGDEERVIAVPDFFEKLTKSDMLNETNFAEQFVRMWSKLLFDSSSVNGDFTLQEFSTLEDIIEALIKFARNLGVSVEKNEDFSMMVTERNNNYLQNDALLKSAGETQSDNTQDTKEAVNPPSAPKSNPSTINVTMNFLSDTRSDTQNSAPPEENEKATVTEHNDDETLESLLEELDGLIGLEGVKKDVHSLMNFIKVTKIREARGMKIPTISYHLVFTGNPGTGKTTIARLVAKLYYHMGILPQGQLVETDRSALVAGYLGQTAIKTQKVIQQAMGGVLFIDEAYSLAGENDDSYGKEAVETILKAMEDHRDELVVIVAGYTELMHKFIDSNPGLSSRFSKYFEFPDYTGDELILIFERFCSKNGYALTQEARSILKDHFDFLFISRDEHFGNARTARNIFEKSINAQANRIASAENINDSDLENITAEDILASIGGAVK